MSGPAKRRGWQALWPDGLGVLFLCTGNSARSILAEAALARRGGDRFRSHSAGSHPKSAPHPMALATLTRLGHPTTGLRSKSWEDFAQAGAPRIDLVVTVCDAAAGEACPVWPGRPMSAHWGVEDPAAFEGSEEAVRAVFGRAYAELDAKIEQLVGLDLPALSADERLAAIRGLAPVGASRDE